QAGPEPVLHSRVEPVSDWPIWQAAVEETAAQTQDNPMITQAASAEIVPGAPKGVGASVPSVNEATALPGKAYPRPNVYRVRRRVSPLSDRLFWKVASLAAMAAIFALTLVMGIAHRFSPLPSTLSQQAGKSGQPVPFQKDRVAPPAPVETKTI